MLLYIDGAAAEMVPSVRYLEVHLAYTPTWCTNTTAVTKKAYQHHSWHREKAILSMIRLNGGVKWWQTVALATID